MIKFMQCIRRKPELTAADFRRFWALYQEAWTDLARASSAERMVTSVGLDITPNSFIQLARGTQDPFDGVLEVWWASGEEVLRQMDRPEIQARIAVTQTLQQQFVDFARSSFFFASEQAHFGQG